LSDKDNKKQEMQSEFISILNKYIIWMEKEDLAPATKYQRKKRNELFLEFLASKGIYSLNSINTETLYEFVLRFEEYSNRTTCLYILILNNFLKYLFLEGHISKDFSCVISTPMKRDERIPSVWKQDEIKAYLGAIDRATVIGKRDYALSLLAIRLGLRGSDIRNLKLGDFDWMNHCININQIKTKEPLSLPLTDEIGWAIIDYIKNARPDTELKNLFVRATPPFTPYDKYGFQSMIDKYCHVAGINMKDRKQGLHSFRHSLVSLLMNNQIPVQVIRSVLGHKSRDSVNEYLKVNTELLRECSLALEVIYG
jgi:integrase